MGRHPLIMQGKTSPIFVLLVYFLPACENSVPTLYNITSKCRCRCHTHSVAANNNTDPAHRKWYTSYSHTHTHIHRRIHIHILVWDVALFNLNRIWRKVFISKQKDCEACLCLIKKKLAAKIMVQIFSMLFPTMNSGHSDIMSKSD